MVNGNIAFSGFSVDDIQKAKAFYGQVLGMDIAEENGALRLSIGSGKTIFVYPKDDHVPATYTILNFPVDDIDTAVDELARAGVKFEHYDLPGLTRKGDLHVAGVIEHLAGGEHPSEVMGQVSLVGWRRIIAVGVERAVRL